MAGCIVGGWMDGLRNCKRSDESQAAESVVGKNEQIIS